MAWFATILFCLIGSLCGAGVHGNFLDKKENSSKTVGHAIAIAEIATNLNLSIESVMGQDSDINDVAVIEKSIWRTFQALPKNQLGRLAPRAVRFIVHNYFVKEHGWLINGLDPETKQADASELHSASILQERAPALVESVLESRQLGRGLSFEDVVVMIAALERLIFQESISLLSAAYTLNDQNTMEEIDEKMLHEVLKSYLLLFRLGDTADLNDYHQHQEDKQRMEEFSESWADMTEYEQDVLWNTMYEDRHKRNPFQKMLFSFEYASEIVRRLARNYGRWQNADCTAMKDHLMSLDSWGNGRVPLDRFYLQTNSSAYHFTETEDYLRSIGALDESGGLSSVRIANYVAGPTNCIAQSAYYSVCCLNECEALMNEIEGSVQSPWAAPEQLLRLVSDISSSTVDAPRRLPKELSDKLHVIGDRNDGAVPVHGRLFAQWMHFAFPAECPFPQQVSSSALTPNQWLDGKAFASSEELEAKRSAFASDYAAPTTDTSLSQWSDEEVLPLHDAKQRGRAFTLVGCFMKATPLLLLLRAAHGAWQAAVSAHLGREDAKKELKLMV